MSEVPEHLLPYLHYQIDGTIIGDTPEAQAYVEQSGWNKGKHEEFRAELEHLSIELLHEINTLEKNNGFNNVFEWNWTVLYNRIFLKPISILEKKSLLKKQKKIEFIFIEIAKKNANLSIQLAFLDILKNYTIHNYINLRYVLSVGFPEKYVMKKIIAGQLKNITIKKYFCIEYLYLPNLASNEVYFLGRNGDGKTLILQSIILALKYISIISLLSEKEAGIILQYINKNSLLSIVAEIIDGTKIGRDVFTDIDNVYAYGAHRHQHTADKKDDNFDTEGFLTLFDNNKELLSPDKWLLDTRMKELDALSKGVPVVMPIKIATNLLENLLNDEDNEKSVTIEVDASKIEVRYKERNGSPIQFEQLSSGYQSVMVWVADLLARMSEDQPHVTKLEDFEAIVLVDEVGLHLHPKWEYSIMKKLRTWFPKIQFIVTTHSPILLMGASEDAIIYKIDKVNGKTNLVGNIPQSEISQMMSNQIITSPLFGLDSMAPPNFETKNASNDDFIYSKIHEAIRTRLANQPTLDDDTILQWINDELNNLPPID